MPGPPPPPPPGGPPPPPMFSMPPPSSGPNERSALLKSIQKGTKLKKTVTVDKSGPMIPGKASTVTSNTPSSNGSGHERAQLPAPPMLNGLGALFSDGIPKLKPVKGTAPSTPNSATSVNNNNNNNHFVNTQKQIKMQIKASDNKNRGPPPPAPTRNIANSTIRDSAPKKLSLPVRHDIAPSPTHLNASTPNIAGLSIEPNRSSLHKKTMSNTNLGSLDNTDFGRNNNNSTPRPNTLSKPQLAPKPPPLNGKPQLKRISLNRTQSMHSPRSPSPQGHGYNDKMKFGTVRNLKQGFIDSLENIHQPAASRPSFAERPKAPPPSVPNCAPPPPPNKIAVKHPGHAPPPPPPIVMNEPPAQAPPPPPHRTPPQIPRSPAPPPPCLMSNGSNAPVPPPRFSSMKDVGDFEARFADKFHDVGDFPPPMPFRGVEKVYLGIQVYCTKQQAPMPPNHLPLSRLWDPPAC